MKSDKNIFLFLLLILVLTASCGSSRKSHTVPHPAVSLPVYAGDYINKYADLAVSEMRRTGIPASITLAQGMLESDYGRSYLARKGNNHFGIKCHNGWTGEKIYHDDERKGECFRKYRNAEDSYRDHSDFLVNGSRYKDLFRLSNTDYRGWAHGLKKAGYATNPDYPGLLIRKIDEYDLHYYDENPRAARKNQKSDQEIKTTAKEGVTEAKTEVRVDVIATTEDDTVPLVTPVTDQGPIKTVSFGTGRIQQTNNVQYVIVQEGDTYRSLAEEFQLLSWEISRYNDLSADTPLQTGQVIYLQPKRGKAEPGLTVHMVKSGETMYMISQKYAIKLSSLYKMNLMEEGTECTAGQKVILR